MSQRKALCLWALAAALPSLPRADAQTESRLREALRATTSQLRALEDERSQLLAADAAQKKEIETLKAKLAVAAQAPRPPPPPRSNDREREQDQEIAVLTRRLTDETQAGARLTKELTQCQTGAREAADACRTRDEERAHLTEQLGLANDRLSDCQSRNAKLFAVSGEILERYTKVNLGDVLGAREPFIGKKRVELENLAQDYEDKLLDQRVGASAK